MASLHKRRFSLPEEFPPFSQRDTLPPGSTRSLAQFLPTHKDAELTVVGRSHTQKQPPRLPSLAILQISVCLML